MRALLFTLCLLSQITHASEACSNFEKEGVKLFSWANGDPPYDNTDFYDSTWHISHLEVPLQEIHSSSKKYLNDKAFLAIDADEVASLMNTDLIRFPAENEKAYLVRGLIYGYSGKIDVYWDRKRSKLYVVHGSFHANFKFSDEELRRKFMLQPVIVYLNDEPKDIEVSFTAGSEAARRKLCGN